MEPLSIIEIILHLTTKLLPSLLPALFCLYFGTRYRKKLGIWRPLFETTHGMIGFMLVAFWIFSALLSNWIITLDPLVQFTSLRHARPGAPVPDGAYSHMLLGGDHLGRDVFSRLIKGSVVVLTIAPLAALVAYSAGIILGLSASYFGGHIDQISSFFVNLILAFPMVLLFFLLATPEIAETGISLILGAFLFLMPLLFILLLIYAKFWIRPKQARLWLFISGLFGGWVYLSLFSDKATAFGFLPEWLDLMDPTFEILNIFIAVVLINTPTAFRIVRGLGLETVRLEYINAAKTRGENPWYIMFWEMLPNIKSPLIVDFCLRIGYITVLFGVLGFLGIGFSPESPDWGTTINTGRKLISTYPHVVLPPALALSSLILGLTLVADAIQQKTPR